MSFLAMIAALLIRQMGDAGSALQQDGWFRDWCRWLAGLGMPGGLVCAVAVILPSMALWWLLGKVHWWLFGLLWLALATAALLYAFGRGAYQDLLAQYRNSCSEGDSEPLQQFALERLNADPEVLEAEGFHHWLQQRLCYLGYQRWFAVLFWFLLLGPAGAVAYRLLQLYASETPDSPAPEVLHWVDWLPCRALCAVFTLTGDFVASSNSLLASLDDFHRPAENVLITVARASLGLGEEPVNDAECNAAEEAEAIQGLFGRAAVAWVLIISLWVVLF